LGTVAAGSHLSIELHDSGVFVRWLSRFAFFASHRTRPAVPQYDERLAAATICIDALSYTEENLVLSRDDDSHGEQASSLDSTGLAEIDSAKPTQRDPQLPMRLPSMRACARAGLPHDTPPATVRSRLERAARPRARFGAHDRLALVLARI
jgi:hypothetical protein